MRILCLVLLLGACTNHVERAQKDCESYGLKPGTTEFAQCTATGVEGRRTRATIRNQ